MKEKINNLIRAGDFIKATILVENMDVDKLEGILLELSFDTEDIGVYTLLNTLLLKEETSEIHHLASVVLAMCFNHFIGGYRVAFHHSKRAIELDPNNLVFKEFMLLFYEIPDRLLDDSEAKSISQEIIRVKPDSKVATNILNGC